MDNTCNKKYIVRRTELIDNVNKIFKVNFVFQTDSKFWAELYIALHHFSKNNYELLNN